MSEIPVLVTREDFEDFVSGRVWARIQQLVRDDMRSAAYALADPSKDADRHQYRAELKILNRFLTITEVVEQELQEDKNAKR